MTITELTDLQNQIENLFFLYWEALPPKNKPRYTHFWYSKGGPRDILLAMFDKMADRIIRESFVAGCPASSSLSRKHLVVCKECEDNGMCIPYDNAMAEIERLVA